MGARFPRWPTPGQLLGIGSSLVVASYTASLVRVAWLHEYFVGDDILSFWMARALPFREFVMTPLDVHWVPLHRLVEYAVNRVAPMNFAVALALLVVVHLGTLVALRGVLRKIRPRPSNALLLAYYALNPYLGGLFCWWTSGLHRLPYVLFATLSIHQYLEFRSSRSWRSAIGVVLFVLASLGFYAKGILLPLCLAAIEVAFWTETTPRNRRIHSALILSLVVPLAAYVVAWRTTTDALSHALGWSPRFLGQFALLGWKMLCLSTAGQVYFGGPVAGTVAAVAVVWAGVIGYSILRSRKSIAAWLCGSLVLTANLVLVAISTVKTALYGVVLAAVDRYYFELSFALVVFVAIAYRDVGAPSFERVFARWPRARWVSAVAGVALLALLSRTAFLGFERSQRGGFANGEDARVFMGTLKASLAEVHSRDPGVISLQDGDTPLSLIPFGVHVRRHSELLLLVGEEVKVDRRRGKYRIDRTGALSVVKRRRR